MNTPKLNTLIPKEAIDNCSGLYAYGSICYGTTTPNSDIDFIVVVNSLEQQEKFLSFFSKETKPKLDFNFYSEENFLKGVSEHEISLLECLYLKDDFVLKKFKHEYLDNFQIDTTQLRHSLSKKSSNSWVKCKKKLTIEADYNLNIGLKSCFHSFRILDFGIQLATEKKIFDYSQTNHIYADIMSCKDFDEIQLKFKQLNNQKSSEFKKVAPLPINKPGI